MVVEYGCLQYSGQHVCVCCVLKGTRVLAMPN